MEDVSIRPMTLLDIGAVLKIEEASFSEPWSYDSLAYDMEKSSAARHLVAVCGQVICGYAGIYHVLDEGQIANVAVLPSFRRRRIGSALMEEMIRRGRAAGLLSLNLEVRSANEAARGLYASFGFMQNGLRKGYYRNPGDDAVLMTLNLIESTT